MIRIASITPIGYRYDKRRKKMISVNEIKFEFTFPDDFIIIIDTREQNGLFISKPPKGLILVRNTLKYGDYSIRGFEDQICIERKDIDDLWTSLTSQGERFRKELGVLAGYERKYILIEGLESEYLAHRSDRKIHPNTIRQALASIEAKLGIPVHQTEDRESAERWVLDLFIKYFHGKRDASVT